MNKARRKAIEDVIEQLELQRSLIDSLQEEEAEAFDNLPESIQYSERGELMEENANDLESASSDLEDVINSLQDILDR